MEQAGKEIFIIKASGERESFSPEKLRNSLARVGASPKIIESIVSEISGSIANGAHVSEIYRRAFQALRAEERHAASRYSLRNSIMELGPSGHPFERLVGKILEIEGFSVRVAEKVLGLCVEHEVDVVADKADRRIMVECKFHNELGMRTDVKVALYVEARFLDIEKRWKQEPGNARQFHEAWLVTNTKLTSDAVQYASCAGMRAIGWNYPKGGSLAELIEQSGLHPLTCLTSLDDGEKRRLLEEGYVVCSDINADALSSLGMREEEKREVLGEISGLCGTMAESLIAP